MDSPYISVWSVSAPASFADVYTCKVTKGLLLMLSCLVLVSCTICLHLLLSLSFPLYLCKSVVYVSSASVPVFVPVFVLSLCKILYLSSVFLLCCHLCLLFPLSLCCLCLCVFALFFCFASFCVLSLPLYL